MLQHKNIGSLNWLRLFFQLGWEAPYAIANRPKCQWKMFSVLAQSNVEMMERRGPATLVFPSLQPSGFSTGSSVFGREMDKEASMQGLVILEARPGTVVYARLPTFHWPELKSHVPSKCVGSGECSQAVDQRKWGDTWVLPGTHLLCHKLKDQKRQSRKRVW